MTDTGIIGILLTILTVIFSYKGFSNQYFFNKYKFNVDRILIRKEYRRILTSGFLHVGWVHLILNMVSLLLFSGSIEFLIGGTSLLIIYFSALLGGSLLALLIHKQHGDYSAVGASGAVCGVIFASIAIFPGIDINFFFVPIPIPGWLFGIVYIGYSIYGIRSKKDNIGHEAHLGGALIGMITALLLFPSAFSENYITIFLITFPSLLFIILITIRPHLLLIENLYFKKHHDFYSIDHVYNSEKAARQQEIDKILDKINKLGIESLSKKEKDTLKENSRKIR